MKHHELFSPKLPRFAQMKRQPIDRPAIRPVKPHTKAEGTSAFPSPIDKVYAYIEREKAAKRRMYQCFGCTMAIYIVLAPMLIKMMLMDRLTPQVTYINDAQINDEPPIWIPKPPPLTLKPPVPEKKVPEKKDAIPEALKSIPEKPTEAPLKSETPEPAPESGESSQDKDIIEDPLESPRLYEEKEANLRLSTTSLIDFSNLGMQGTGKSGRQHAGKALLGIPSLQQRPGRGVDVHQQPGTGAILERTHLSAGISEKTPEKPKKPTIDDPGLPKKLPLQTLPKLLKQVAPTRPSIPEVVQCTVTLRMWVETDGTPSDIRVHQVKIKPSVDEAKRCLFEEAAIEAVKQFEFKPARQDNHPVRTEIDIPITFDLQRPEKRL